MFRISVVDHIRLNFDRTSQNYTLHAKAAERLAVMTARMRIGVLILLAIAAVSAATCLVETGRPFQIAAAIAAGLAFAAHAAYLAIGLEGRVHAHRACAERLWVVCDRYQSLLSEIEDGMLDRATILQRRDDLSAEMHAAYDQPFSLDQRAYEAARHAAAGDARPAPVTTDAPEAVLPAPIEEEREEREEAMQNGPAPH
jgi:SMODS and SLOG-associating 2TM effector domain family 4